LLLAEMGNHNRARQEHEQARELQSKLVKGHADVPHYRIALAGTCCNLGNLLYDSREVRQSLNLFAEAIDLLQAVRHRLPDDPTARLFLRNSHWGRARALTRLGRHRQAVADWDQAGRLDTGPQGPFFRLSRADSRARAGDYLPAATEADDLGRAPSLPGATLFHLACIHALNAASAARDLARPLPEREKRAEQYARQAVTLLKRAASAGYFRDAAKVAHLDKDSDLDFLRDRGDYKQFRAGLKTSK
jgi:tetratricopeptide (TPR) repeat protein